MKHLLGILWYKPPNALSLPYTMCTHYMLDILKYIIFFNTKAVVSAEVFVPVCPSQNGVQYHLLEMDRSLWK